MSLLSEAMEDCIFIDETTAPDGYGGTLNVYADGAPFQAAFVEDTSTEAKIAQAQGVRNIYTVTTAKNVLIREHKLFKRLSDGTYFQATSDGKDVKAPKSATLDMRQVTAREWSMPT